MPNQFSGKTIALLLVIIASLFIGIVITISLISTQETTSTLTLSPSATYTTNATWSLQTQIRLIDSAEKLDVVVTAITGSMILTLNGTDASGVVQTENLTLSEVKIYTTTKSFRTIKTDGLTLDGVTAGESVTLSITQSVWSTEASNVWTSVQAYSWIAFGLIATSLIIIASVVILSVIRGMGR